MSSYTMPASPLGRSAWGPKDRESYRRSSVASTSYEVSGGHRLQPRSPLASTHQPTRHVSGPTHPSQPQRYTRWSSQALEADGPASPPWDSVSSQAGRRRSSVQSLTTGQTPNIGSLVGSFQESLLRGRMSMPASKPLTFEAELGVLGLGRCRPSVRCPPHISLSFPAHFYNLGSIASSSPRADLLEGLGSPYVGTIDLEGHYNDRVLAHRMSHLSLGSNFAVSSDLPTFPGYAVPPKGRLQLVVKYPNLNAVKLFLVPYDLTDMPAGTKTFVRQKSVLVHTTPDSTDCDLASSLGISPQSSPQHSRGVPRETLRFAIHLQFCSPPASSGKKSSHAKAGFEKASSPHSSTRSKNKVAPRIYLHKSIRVVFAARALDSSDNLVEVIETPGQGLNRFAAYEGPEEQWFTILNDAKARISASENEVQLNSAGLGIDIPTPADVKTDCIGPSANNMDDHLLPLNSDPNGERWIHDDTLSSGFYPLEREPPNAGLALPSADRRTSTTTDSTTILPWDTGRAVSHSRGESESTRSTSVSMWQDLRRSWWKEAFEQQTSTHTQPSVYERPSSRRAWSYMARSDSLGSEHSVSSSLVRIGTSSKSEALVQPIFAQGDFDEHSTAESVLQRAATGQPSLLRQLSEQIGRSYSPSTVPETEQGPARPVHQDIKRTSSTKATEKDFLLR